MSKIYISGPITGNPYFKGRFCAMEAKLAAYGYTPLSPAFISPPKGCTEDHWQYCIKEAIKVLITADGVIMLDGWDTSKGAQLERIIALGIGIPVFFQTTANAEDIDFFSTSPLPKNNKVYKSTFSEIKIGGADLPAYINHVEFLGWKVIDYNAGRGVLTIVKEMAEWRLHG